jgi:5-methylcytosine-specific restriction protein A
MPNAAKSVCNEPLCNKLTEGRYCADHKRENVNRQTRRQYDDHRGSAASRGYGYRWTKLRQLVLHRDPICQIGVICGFLKASTDADHITPKSAGGEDTMENLQGACHECHSWKTATQDSRFAKKQNP